MLEIIETCFLELENRKIPYIHWKSNERLSEFIHGESDLDLLFYPGDYEKVNAVFKKIDAKKFEALPLGKYPNIEDFLSVDSASGKLIHFHVHYGLDIGEKNIKRYSLPWTDELMQNRIKHEKEPVWITSHEHELLLLILRETLRIPPYRIYLKSATWGISSSVPGEYNWLKKRSEKEKFLSVVKKLVSRNTEIVKIFEEIYENGITLSRLYLLRKKIDGFRKKYRIRTSFVTNIYSISDKLKNKSHPFLTKIYDSGPQKRINKRGGMIVVFTGSDGAGKSTTIGEVAKVFGEKLDVKKMYFGLPKPESFLFPFLVKQAKRIGLRPLLNLYMKRYNLHKAVKLRKKGVFVLCDRFPQTSFNGIMDGPLMTHWIHSGNPLKRWMAFLEKKIFQQIYQTEIDLVVKLIVEPEISSRRGKHPIDVARKKTEIVRQLSFPNAMEVLELDTTQQSVDEVKRSAVNGIWEKIH